MSPMPRRIRKAARRMLDELQHNRLEVIKYRRDDEQGFPIWKRSAISQNPTWYRRLCDDNLRTRRRYRKARTIIKRCHVLLALRQIAGGLVNTERLYVARVLEAIGCRWKSSRW